MLSAELHSRLLADIDHICATAHIPKGMLNRSAKEFCKGAELDWLVRYPHWLREGKSLVMTGQHTPAPDMKMMAMTAAFLRNYIDARVITVNALIASHEAGDPVDPTVLLVPNLFLKQGGKGLPSWQMQVVYDILLSRMARGRLSCVYVESIQAMGQEYGHNLVQHLEQHYLTAG